MPKVHFISPLDDATVEVEPGTSLLEAAESGHVKMGHQCGGVCACSTCHCWIRKGAESLSEQSEDEMDRLDQAFDVRAYSRLGCQSKVSNEDVVVELTQESLVAYLDENPALRRQLEAEGKWPLKR
ncbi:MAG: 2Fe-2S iron-sulfur cluster-binding protein [Myxococcaceae bacterium]